MAEYEEEKKQWQEVSLWLRVRLGVRGISLYRIYDNLPNHLKDVLHKCICVPVQITTDSQRENLFRALNVAGGRDSVDPLVHMTEERDSFLSPLTEKEKADYL